MTDDLVTRLLQFEGSDALGDGDFSVCTKAAAEITRLNAVIAAKDEALDKIATHESTVDYGHMECANCKDAYLDDYFSVKAFARAALNREPAQTGGEGA